MARIHEALVAIVREVEPISKDSENRAQGYRFRGVEAVVGMIQPLLAKHGVVMLPRVLDADHDTYPTKSGGTMHSAKLSIAWRFVADDGSCEEIVTVGEGADAGDKASNKAMTASQKYAITLAFSVPWNADDGDADSPEERAPQGRPAQSQGAPPARKSPGSDFVNEKQAGLILYRVVQKVGEGDDAPRRECLRDVLAECGLPNQWPNNESPKAWLQQNVPWKKMDALLAAIEDWAMPSPAPEEPF